MFKTFALLYKEVVRLLINLKLIGDKNSGNKLLVWLSYVKYLLKIALIGSVMQRLSLAELRLLTPF